ncbi:MAG: thioredoxin family protein [Candidatus Obscuribacterales bacterium]|nr:thioredoxin family protein [Candidatus Obscuribacterales bacterium]
MKKVQLLALALLLVPLVNATLPTSAENSAAEDIAEAQKSITNPVKATLVSESKEIQAGEPFTLAVQLNMQPGWHTYYKDPGESGLATSIDWTLPKGFSASQIEWEKPTKFVEAGVTTYGYQKKTVLRTKITPPAQLKDGEPYSFTAKVKWLSCKEICLPGKAELSLSIKAAAKAPTVATPQKSAGNSSHSMDKEPPPPTISSVERHNVSTGTTSEQSTNFFTYIAFAFIGGFLLNLMPCVLPVISIKVLSLLEQSRDEPKEILKSGLIFSSGIIASFMFLAVLVLALKSFGQSIGWGFQFQHPAFLIAMSTVVLVLSLSLMGLFYVSAPTQAQSGVDRVANREGALGTFGKGVLATLLSTPCTAPFLGTAIGFGFSQPAWVLLTIFFVVSLGMASPYILLTAQPKWMCYLPKPGPWMEQFKEAMGFLLLATVVWLLSVLGQQVGLIGVLNTLAFLLAVSFATWITGRFINLSSSSKRKFTTWAVALAICAGAYQIFLPAVFQAANSSTTETATLEEENGIIWMPYKTELLDKMLRSGKTVFLDFTADWCLTCKVNEKTVIATKPVIDKFKSLGVVTMKADWTKQNPDIGALLQQFGRSGVPLYVIFPGNDPEHPIVLPEVITQSLVLEKLDLAGKSKS